MDQTNLIVDSGVHPSLYCKCHHQITYCRYNLTAEYPPPPPPPPPLPYGRLVCDYKKTDIESIKQALILTNWHHLFLNKDVCQQVKIITDTLFNVFSNFTPYKVVTFDDRDPPPWMTDFINFQSEIENVLVFYLKERVTTADKLAQKLIGPSATSKTFCFILRTSLIVKKHN